MIDDNWDEISGDAAHEIEVLNYSNQVNVIEALVRLLLHRYSVTENGCAACPTIRVLQEFHRTATLFLLHNPGEFRQGEVHVNAGGKVVHIPPTADKIDHYLGIFFQQLNDKWPVENHTAIAAFALWFVNWVHPFPNGNGRTARAFAYACLELKLGFILPGETTVIDLIMQNREDYNAALKHCDNAFEQTGELALEPMAELIDRLLEMQLEPFAA